MSDLILFDDFFERNPIIFETNYKNESKLFQMALKNQCKYFIEGIEMLIYQAFIQSELFIGKKPKKKLFKKLFFK